MKITFLGAANTVTGSKYLIEHNQAKLLIDCGLFQGKKELRLKNRDPLPVDAASLEAVILTHAHIDHSGYIPLLIKQGFKGQVICTEATFDLCRILLPDSGRLHEEDARLANKYGYSKHHPALPLYTERDAEDALEYFRTIGFHETFRLSNGLHFTFRPAGHILGSAIVTLSDGSTAIVFSGDLGRPYDRLMRPPEAIDEADYLVIESTYGNRRHSTVSPTEELGNCINETLVRGGSIIIPSFAVGRAQSILYHIYLLKKNLTIPDVPVYVDSPMATDASALLCHYPGEHRLEGYTCSKVCGSARYTRNIAESKAIAESPTQCIIISASGMATGGRVLHHLKRMIPDPKNLVLFAGFQAEGTRGDRMMRGEAEIKIHGEMIPLRAEVKNLSNISTHADYEELLAWLRHFKKAPRTTFITHGEPDAALSLKEKIEIQLGWKAVVPAYMDSETLTS